MVDEGLQFSVYVVSLRTTGCEDDDVSNLAGGRPIELQLSVESFYTISQTHVAIIALDIHAFVFELRHAGGSPCSQTFLRQMA